MALVFTNSHSFPTDLENRNIRMKKYPIDLSILDVQGVQFRLNNGKNIAIEAILSDINADQNDLDLLSKYNVFIPDFIDLQKYQWKSIENNNI